MSEKKQIRFSSNYLNRYLDMVEDTESPRIFHIWAAVGAIASALGRRSWFQLGHERIYANHYICLVGTPATRKSVAVKLSGGLISKSTGVRFAPDDTAGQRQGLIAAMQWKSDENPLFLEGQRLAAGDNTLMGLTLQDIAMITDESPDEESFEIATADRQHILALSDEFSTFIGENSASLLDFLTSCWNGKSYKYQTKTGITELKNPLLNIIGATTPVSLARSMPKVAAGQGILSRMILVYGARKYKSIPRPNPLPFAIEDEVKEIINHVYEEIHGAFTETDEAKEYCCSLYEYPLEISDTRFVYYAERRYTHLIKLAMVLAAADASCEIARIHYEEAHKILRATERGMPEALGEFGMNPLASLKQAVLEFMRDVGAMELAELRVHFHRDSRSQDFMEAVHDLIKNKQLAIAQNSAGKTYITALMGKFSTDESIVELLSQKS